MRRVGACLVVSLVACGDLGTRATLLRDPAQEQDAISFETGVVGSGGDLGLSVSGTFGANALYATGAASNIDDIPVPPPANSAVLGSASAAAAAVEGQGFLVHTSAGCPTRVIVTGYPSGGVYEGVEIGWEPVDCRKLTIDVQLDPPKSCINPIEVGGLVAGWDTASGPIGTSQWPTGTAVQLDGGSAFESWSGACADPTSPTCSIVLTDDVAITATLDAAKVGCDPGP